MGMIFIKKIKIKKKSHYILNDFKKLLKAVFRLFFLNFFSFGQKNIKGFTQI